MAAVVRAEPRFGAARRTAARRAWPAGSLDAVRQVVDALPEPVVVAGRGCLVLAANRAAGDVFGCEPDAMRGASAAGLVRLALTGRYDGALLRHLDAGSPEGRIGTVGFDGAKAVRDDGTDAGLVVRAGLLELGEESLLLLAVHERRAVSGAAGGDEDAADVRDVFVRAATHDLRSPLAVIVMLAELMLTRADERPDDRRALEMTLQSGAHVQRILSDLADLDRLASRGIVATPSVVDVGDVVGDAVARAAQGRRRVDVEAPDGLLAALDARLVDRIVENLVGNALKHTPPEVGVAVRIRVADEGLRIVVTDRGPGVPDDLKLRVFALHARGETRAEGTGCGLYVVAEFARLHGGRAWVEDAEGGGAAFHVSLPVWTGTRARD